MEMSVESAYHRSIKTLFDWINNEVDTNKTQVVFRTYAPVHFRLVQLSICSFGYYLPFSILLS